VALNHGNSIENIPSRTSHGNRKEAEMHSVRHDAEMPFSTSDPPTIFNSSGEKSLETGKHHSHCSQVPWRWKELYCPAGITPNARYNWPPVMPAYVVDVSN